MIARPMNTLPTLAVRLSVPRKESNKFLQYYNAGCDVT
jgi:hypothetical protein